MCKNTSGQIYAKIYNITEILLNMLQIQIFVQTHSGVGSSWSVLS